MIANLPTVSRTNLLHACVTLTCSTKKYRELKTKNKNLFYYFRSVFFFLFEFPGLWFWLCFYVFFVLYKTYVIPSGASSLSAVVQLLTRLLVTSSLASLTPPSAHSISDLCHFVLPLLMVCIDFFSEPSVLDLQHV